jgi:hypothetical protein
MPYLYFVHLGQWRELQKHWNRRAQGVDHHPAVASISGPDMRLNRWWTRIHSSDCHITPSTTFHHSHAAGHNNVRHRLGPKQVFLIFISSSSLLTNLSSSFFRFLVYNDNTPLDNRQWRWRVTPAHHCKPLLAGWIARSGHHRHHRTTTNHLAPTSSLSNTTDNANTTTTTTSTTSMPTPMPMTTPTTRPGPTMQHQCCRCPLTATAPSLAQNARQRGHLLSFLY